MEFQYTRQQGQRLTYLVKLLIMVNVETGKLVYSAKVHRPDGDYVGPLKAWPLTSTDTASAEQEARSYVNADIENLVGINE